MSIEENPVAANTRQVLNLLSTVLPASNANTSASQRVTPVMIGLTGLQGSGKSTWATSIVSILRNEYGLSAITVSPDDFYKTHQELVALRTMNKDNQLFRTRGQPGTHDEVLTQTFFTMAHREVDLDESEKNILRIPSFDKSQFDGQGDRAPEHMWPMQTLPLDVIVFEGWCVGFQSLPESAIREKYSHAARAAGSSQYPVNTLADHDLKHLLQVNKHLAVYNASFMGPQCFDCLIHLDTDNLANVYTWRLDQENALRKKTRGLGMTNQAVVDFVRGYMPAYELYLDQLRQGFFARQENEHHKKQIRVCLDEKRKVIEFESV